MYIFNSFFTYNGMLSMKEINRRTEQENESAEQCIFLSSNGLCNTIWVLFKKKTSLWDFKCSRTLPETDYTDFGRCGRDIRPERIMCWFLDGHNQRLEKVLVRI